MDLRVFSELDFLPALHTFFSKLNVPVHHIADEPTTAKNILKDTYKDNDTFKLTNDVYFVGMVDDATFGNKKDSIELDKIKKDYDGILIFGVTLHKRPNGLLPTRSQLAEIARAFNREFYYTPVVVVFKYNNHIAFANTERLKYKQDWREGEKAGKVSLLRDINIKQPHAGHHRILAELEIPTSSNNKVDSFAKLYAYWQEVLSVNILNKKFYKELSNWYFWAVKEVQFPGAPTFEDAHVKGKDLEDLKQEHKATNVIRMLTRLLFVWFLKEKKLIPGELFDLKTLQDDILNDINPVKQNGFFKEQNIDSIYYKAILQNLFFATLNCPIEGDSIDKRKRGFRLTNSNYGTMFLMRYEKYFKDKDGFLEMMNKTVPFLNGGLFECLDERGEGEKRDERIWIDGFSDNLPKDQQLVVPDYLFFGVEEQTDLSDVVGIATNEYKQAAVKGLINILESYKFTITENTPIEEDVALDPELLGRVFENLLASYNPETKTTARKQTGSFYTPREIVNYMVDESLIAYLTNVLEDSSLDNEHVSNALSKLVSFDSTNPFEKDEELTKQIIIALSTCTILDPACGSGAFPMGILQKMVHILQKLDPDNTIWKEVQREKAKAETEEAFSKEEDKSAREQRLIEINEAFDQSINDPDYARKLFLIENCIFGVDIQPIATQISKLRFFISLVVEQKVNSEKENFGIRPLPNLETKFVTANTLIGIDRPKGGDQLNMFNTEKLEILEKQLKEVRSKLFSAKSKETKVKYRKLDEELRNAIADELQQNGWESDTAKKLASWDPYDQNASSSFFDPEWMFDIKEGFDVVIGNPPYIDSEGMVTSGNGWLRELIIKTYSLTKGNWDIYIAFFELSFRILKPKGALSFITPDKWLSKPFGKELRQYSLPYLSKLFRSGRDVFESVGVDSIVTIFVKDSSNEFSYLDMCDGKIKLISSIRKNIFQPPFQIDIVFSPHIKLLVDITDNNLPLVESFDLECENACSTADCYILKEILQDGEPDNNPDLNYKVINTGTIGEYISRWGQKEMTYLKDKYLNPIVSKSDFHRTFPNSYGAKASVPKLIIKGLTLLDVTIDQFGEFIPGKSTLIIKSDNISKLIVLVGLLNSSLPSFYIKQRYSASSYNTGINFTKDMLNNLPVPNFTILNESILKSFVEVVLKSRTYVEDKFYICFKEVLDATIFNFYFTSHMEKRCINVLEFVERDIVSVLKDSEFENLTDKEKEDVIEQLHSTWTNPNNEVVKRIAMFREKSPDILGVILDS